VTFQISADTTNPTIQMAAIATEEVTVEETTTAGTTTDPQMQTDRATVGTEE